MLAAITAEAPQTEVPIINRVSCGSTPSRGAQPQRDEKSGEQPETLVSERVMLTWPLTSGAVTAAIPPSRQAVRAIFAQTRTQTRYPYR